MSSTRQPPDATPDFDLTEIVMATSPPPPKTIDEYIAASAPEARAILAKIVRLRQKQNLAAADAKRRRGSK
jgi:uncharacterized protein (UPF0276 family)